MGTSVSPCTRPGLIYAAANGNMRLLTMIMNAPMGVGLPQ